EAPAPAADAAPAEEAPALKLSFFGDAFFSFQSAAAGTAAPWHRAYDSSSPALDNRNGFGLAFVGMDATYSAGDYGATASLRFGPGVPQFYATDTGALGIDNIVQGYVTWLPTEKLTLDLGQFGTPFGAEVAESWKNLNYTRGGLYYGMQPFWHTGLRANYQFSDAVGLKVLAVNGVNTTILDDETPSVGAQLALVPADGLSIALGGLVNPYTEDKVSTSVFDRFFDVVVTASFGDATIIFNADYNQNVAPDGAGDDTSWYGLSLAGGYKLSDKFGVALRGEYLVDADNQLYGWGAGDDGPDGVAGTPDDVAADPDAADPVSVITGTLTLDYRPAANSNLVLRLDNRVEQSNRDIYFDREGAATKTWFTSTVGMVVNTDG
ncbi:MAG: outer membrane beta-barrel protein, partial [Deltaproteobacteria bacterium]|nr:outer membrane beta-barrel protein [Deltaproteobacteria bacterium]